MRTITVKVTQKHIDKGVPSDTECCPLAMALHDAGYPKATVVVLYWRPVRLEPGCKLSGPARKFRRRFDEGKPVRPQTFRLQAPEPAKGAE